MIKLSILIPTLPERAEYLARLKKILAPQIASDIEVLTDSRPRGMSIGEKRNALLDCAKGKYTVFIDDDDTVSLDYIDSFRAVYNSGSDCGSLIGVITQKGVSQTFIHSLKYDRYYEENGIYYRYPNHLNFIKAEISKAFKFKDSNWGEDTDWATQIHNVKAIKTEFEIPYPIYFYTPSSERNEGN